MSPTNKWIAVVLGCTTLALAAACSDDVSVDGDDKTAGDDTTGDAGGDAAGDGGTCTTKTDVAASSACTLYQAKPGTELTLQLVEQCGSPCGGAKTPACTVTVAGTDITLSLDQEVCAPPTDEACPEICRVNAYDCKVPALATGFYRVHFNVNDEKAETILNVSDTGTQTSCQLPFPPAPPEPVSTAPFNGTDCRTVDANCAPVLAGDPCRPCDCPEGAVLQSVKDAYEATYYAAKSMCADTGRPVCAACQMRTAVCNADTGKCELAPLPK